MALNSWAVLTIGGVFSCFNCPGQPGLIPQVTRYWHFVTASSDAQGFDIRNYTANSRYLAKLNGTKDIATKKQTFARWATDAKGPDVCQERVSESDPDAKGPDVC